MWARVSAHAMGFLTLFEVSLFGASFEDRSAFRTASNNSSISLPLYMLTIPLGRLADSFQNNAGGTA
jgi:hypothetical protein